MREEKRDREREMRKRVFRFSLKSMEIEPSVFVGARRKLIHVSQATRGYQNLRVSSNFTWWGIFLLEIFLA